MMDDQLPPPLEIISDEAATQGLFPAGHPGPTDPAGAANLWWSALIQDRRHFFNALTKLSYPGQWGDFSREEQLLRGWSMVQNAEYAEHAAGLIAHVAFVPDTGHSMRAFDDYQLPECRWLTLVRCTDDWWRAWSLPDATNVRSSPEDVLAALTLGN